jgi:hypothetical protein
MVFEALACTLRSPESRFATTRDRARRIAQR